MKIFLDTANIEQIREAASWGVVDGVTTNPSHVAKTGRRPRELYREICNLVDGPVSLETIYANYGYETKILAAAIRHPNHVLEAALAGADVCTMSFEVLEQLYRHPLTDSGVEQFLKDWATTPKG